MTLVEAFVIMHPSKTSNLRYRKAKDGGRTANIRSAPEIRENIPKASAECFRATPFFQMEVGDLQERVSGFLFRDLPRKRSCMYQCCLVDHEP